MVKAMENSRTSIDRAHRVVLGTGLERLEHLLKRIWEGFTRIPRRKTGILEFSRTWLKLWKIREHQSIELIELYLEPGTLGTLTQTNMGRFYQDFETENWYFGIYSDMVCAMENPRTPIDRAHRVVLGTGNAWNTYSNEYGKVFSGFRDGKLVFWNLLGHGLRYGESENTNR
jgi:hypothetical protein